jgi:hypothetical protein
MENKRDTAVIAFDTDGASVALFDGVSNTVCPSIGCIYVPQINVQPSR